MSTLPTAGDPQTVVPSSSSTVNVALASIKCTVLAEH